MSVKLEWEIIDQDARWQASPPPKPAPRRRWWLAAVAVALVALAAGAACLAWMYRARLGQVREPVRAVANLEAQALASRDQAVFMALQDPDDATWREAQAQRFAQLTVGLPQFGWEAARVAPQVGDISLEPGGVRVDVTYRFSVTQPLPGGPATLDLRVPQFYDHTSGGWAHVRQADASFWGRLLSGRDNRVWVYYYQRDAGLIEPLISQLGETAERICYALPCPAEVSVTFEAAAESLTPTSPWYGFSEETTLRLPSPHLLGLPSDASRAEFYRAIKIRLALALVDHAAGGRLNFGYAPARELARWELARAGLTGPFVTEEMTRALAAELDKGAWQSLGDLPLGTRARELYNAPEEALSSRLLPFAFAFIEENLGAGSVTRLAPALMTRWTLGQAISTTLGVDAGTLQVAWWKYLRRQAGRPVADVSAPEGELALMCSSSYAPAAAAPVLWRVRADGSGLTRIADGVAGPAWSPDGERLAYTQTDDGLIVVLDEALKPLDYSPKIRGAPVGWLPDKRLWAAGMAWYVLPDGLVRTSGALLADLDTGAVVELAGTGHLWTPAGTRVAYLSLPNLALWVADADGQNAQQLQPGWLTAGGQFFRRVAPGYEMVWSPDGKRLAFTGLPVLDQPGGEIRYVNAGILVYTDGDGAISTLASEQDLLQLGARAGFDYISSLAWSPDGSRLAVGMSWEGGPSVVILDASDGQVGAQLAGTWQGAAWLLAREAWSPDGRYLAFDAQRDDALPYALQLDTLVIWDTQLGRAAALPGGRWAWSPDGQWLAVAQAQGVLFVKPDLAGAHWLKLPNCYDVTWRPGH